MLNRPSLRTALLSVLSLTLGACGYHLRGEDAGTPGLLPIGVQAPLAAQPAAQALRQRLASRGWATTGSETKASVSILEERIDKRAASLATTGLVSEYIVVYHLRFQVVDAREQTLQAPRELTFQRIYRFDPAQALAMTWQEERLAQTMRALAIDEIMRALGRIPAPAGGQRP